MVAVVTGGVVGRAPRLDVLRLPPRDVFKCAVHVWARGHKPAHALGGHFRDVRHLPVPATVAQVAAVGQILHPRENLLRLIVQPFQLQFVVVSRITPKVLLQDLPAAVHREGFQNVRVFVPIHARFCREVIRDVAVWDRLIHVVCNKGAFVPRGAVVLTRNRRAYQLCEGVHPRLVSDAAVRDVARDVGRQTRGEGGLDAGVQLRRLHRQTVVVLDVLREVGVRERAVFFGVDVVGIVVNLKLLQQVVVHRHGAVMVVVENQIPDRLAHLTGGV